MTILGIETSCDETGAALVEKHDPGFPQVIKNTLSSSVEIHAKTGGIIPENAAREQLKYIISIVKEVLGDRDPKKEVDAIAITYGPGLIGSLLVGVETARTLSYIWNKPLIPVNHLYGHIYANWLDKNSEDKITFPAIALVVSGGHTDLLLMRSHIDIEVLGATRDDAAGEAFDKVGRLLGLPYPAGPLISKLAENGDANTYDFPRPMIASKDFDFSFSGLKTAVLNEVKKSKPEEQDVYNICASFEKSVVEVLVKKTIAAAKTYNASSIILGGGVAANEKLREALKSFDQALYIPEKKYCTDNAAMIAAAAFYRNTQVSWREVQADPQLYY